MRILAFCAVIGAIACCVCSGPALAVTGPDAAPEPIIIYNPFTIPGDGSLRPLKVRVTFPANGRHAPVIIFSHGNAYSKDDYLPLTEYWAQHGFVVIQPTHPDAAVGGFAPADPRIAETWRIRIEDMRRVAASLDLIEANVPGLKGGLDDDAVIAAGHSFGGHTVAALIGATVKDPKTNAWLDLSDKRFKGAIILAAPGAGGSDLAPDWSVRGAFLDMDWSGMRRPALVVAGALDTSPMTIRDAAWHQDPYWRGPVGGKCLIVLKNAKHYMGGILGVHRTEVDDEDQGRLHVVQAETLEYMEMILDAKSKIPAASERRLADDSGYVQSLVCK